MADPAPQTSIPATSKPLALIRGLGTLALVASLLVISTSVVGRHIGVVLPGSLEIVEMLFVVVAASAMVFTTVERAHAAARLILDQLGPSAQYWVIKAGLLFGAVVWLAVTTGNLWLLYDVWSLHEVSPLLGIPVVPFRIMLSLATGTMALALLWQLFSDPGEGDDHA